VWDSDALAHGTMSVVLFTPRGTDYQTPHEQDELYFVVRGSGELVVDGKAEAFTAGDVLFVPARVPHRLERFTDDLVTWAVFWGPVGGERTAE
jgi:mannose-6-phosphate isomerase-like protein (cupin superfamily)